MGNATNRWIAALAALAAVCLWLDFRNIAATLPYPQHIDEPALSNPAIRMLKTGSLHPGAFDYPSLPRYVTAVGMALGFLRAAGAAQLHEVAKIGNVAFPYYDVPEVMQGARQLFAISAVVGLLATGAAAFQAFRRPATLLLAPAALALSPLFLADSWSYLNVDIMGLCFVMLTIAATLAGTRHPSFARSALVPGMCAGLAAGSKYTLAVVILPVLFAVTLFVPAGRRVVAAFAAVIAMIVTFLVVVPYALLDIPGIMDGLAFDAFHYATGHAGVNVEPGFPQVVAYTRDLASELGVVALLFAEVGMCLFLTVDVRRTLVLLAFPLALLRMLVTTRVHFARNELPLLGIGAMYAAYGCVRAHDRLLTLARARNLKAPWVKPVAAGLVCLVVLPFWRVADWVRDRTDSRTLAVSWIRDHVPKSSIIVVPSELHLKANELGRPVQEIALMEARTKAAFNQLLEPVGARPAVILLPQWTADERSPGQKLAEELNAAGAGFPVLQHFGADPLLVNYPETAPSGNPAFSIVKLVKRKQH